MEFDLELPVLMLRAGTPVRNLATRVRYLTAEEGGISHFDLWRDNVRISWAHTRLVLGAARDALLRRRPAPATRADGSPPGSAVR
jgi:hypothetical protein